MRSNRTVDTDTLRQGAAKRRWIAGTTMRSRRFTGLRLRQAEAGDVSAIASCVQAAYAAWVPRLGRKPWPMLQDYAVVVRDQQVTVAEFASEIVGVLVQEDTCDGSLIENVAVRPDFKGSGVGRALLMHAEQAALAQGHSSVYLYTNELMIENIQMYARAGFAEYERRQESGFRRVFMRKSLGENAG